MNTTTPPEAKVAKWLSTVPANGRANAYRIYPHFNGKFHTVVVAFVADEKGPLTTIFDDHCVDILFETQQELSDARALLMLGGYAIFTDRWELWPEKANPDAMKVEDIK